VDTLPTDLRNKLERTIIEARDVAEAGAKAALEALAVHHHEPYGHMSPEERKLRNHLRARARQLGDKQNQKGELEITHLIWECAYEHWHRMLFARFLAENALLIEPEMGVAISLEECEELAKQEGKDLWTLASEFAQRMLPQIFRPNDPILKFTFAREHRIKLEKLLDDLEPGVFTASDSLGWVYQFWQTKRKKEVNESGNKIGADELPAVTQSFTEPYMVNFLIHNTLGAWWAGKVLAERPELAELAESEEELRQAVALPGVSWDYLRFIRTNGDKGPWHPAAGTFESWPKSPAELRILDPCCGSGHFLVALLNHLVPLRTTAEGLSTKQAIDAVLLDNLNGLEIDERCTEISAFALALAAWTYTDAGGYHTLPLMNIACAGVAPNIKKDRWVSFAGDDDRLREGMTKLFDLFKEATSLGSLIDPEYFIDETLFRAGFEKLIPYFERLISEESDNYQDRELGVSAYGIFESARLLTRKYHLIVTNVPYLVRGKQAKTLKDFLERHYCNSKQDIATGFVERAMRFCANGGTIAMVTPQAWRFQPSYKDFRIRLLKEMMLNLVTPSDSRAFGTISGAIVNVLLLISTQVEPLADTKIQIIDASKDVTPKEKAISLATRSLQMTAQQDQLKNPDARLTLTDPRRMSMLSDYAVSVEGLSSGDLGKFVFCFWEVQNRGSTWSLFHRSPNGRHDYSGTRAIVRWENGKGELASSSQARIQGHAAWGKKGVLINCMHDLHASLYVGAMHDKITAAIVPNQENLLGAIWHFCCSTEYKKAVRESNPALQPGTGTLVKVPFDLEEWTRVSKEMGPIPVPNSSDPSEWLFEGKVISSNEPLQVAVSRLLGYRWPNQKPDNLNQLGDSNGLLCIPSIRGEEPAAERVRAILATAYDNEWTTSREMELLAATGSKAKNLGESLQDNFFEQHSKLFLHRPFIWHIWDGRRRDGFHALVNYHKLAERNGKGRQLLESLTYSYLGDWITRQKEGVKRGEGGAEDRLAAALELQKRLIAIIEGEPPFDIFVRWKPIEEQPIGWEPDINDGVRLNIRPFMAQDIPGGRKGTGVLRWKPNIKWNKDRGKDVASAPWFALFKGDRVNDHHLSLEEKRNARAEANRRQGESENG
jgi:hypothetical protein